MADGDIKTHAEICAAKGRHLEGSMLSFGDEYYVEVAVQVDDLDAETLEDAAGRVTKAAACTLHIARLRGENGNDSPGTLAGALEAAEMCLELAIGFRTAAQQLRKEKAHG